MTEAWPEPGGGYKPLAQIGEPSQNGQKAIRLPKEGAKEETNPSLQRAGRKNALALSLLEAPVVETLPLAGHAGVVFKGLSNVLAAYPKVGKTTLLWLSLLDWLPDHRVLYVTEESEFIWRVRLSGFVSSLDHLYRERIESDLSRLEILNVEGRSSAELLEESFGGNEDIVVVDTLRHVLRFSQETDNSEIAAQVTPWIEAARIAEKTFVGSHHSTKAGGEHGRGIAGGHALLGVFDMAIEVERDRNAPTRRQVSVLGRLEPVEDFYYELADGRIKTVGDVSAVKAAEVRRRILDSLATEGQDFDSVHEGIDEPRPGKQQVRDALKALVDSGDVVREGAGKKNNPYTWRLPEKEDR